jgi:hypothetical protein
MVTLSSLIIYGGGALLEGFAVRQIDNILFKIISTFLSLIKINSEYF